jgi:hypothetical protein
MVKNSSVLNVGITNTQTLAQQKPSEIERRKKYVGTPRNLVLVT